MTPKEITLTVLATLQLIIIAVKKLTINGLRQELNAIDKTYLFNKVKADNRTTNAKSGSKKLMFDFDGGGIGFRVWYADEQGKWVEITDYSSW